MSREIKFRIWSKVWTHDDSEQREMFYFSFPNDLYKITDQNSGSFNREGELMQSTGLLDSNSQEIFEGDILSITYYSKPYAVTIDYSHGMRFMIGVGQICAADAMNAEIIGNIYENPELLN